MRWVLLLVLPACMLGAGPVVGVRTNGTVAVGGEAGATIYNIGARSGLMYGLVDGKGLGYAAATGIAPIQPRKYDDDGPSHTGIGGMIGATLESQDTDLFAGVFADYTRGDRSGCAKERMYSIQAGVRRVGKHIEFFVHPAIHLWQSICFD